MPEHNDIDIMECPSVRLAGPSEGPLPEQIYGMLSALLLRSGDIGDEIASAMADLGVPLPEGSFRVVQFSLDDPILAQVPVQDRHSCRIRLYDRLRDRVLEQLDPEDRGFLFLLSGYLLGILYTGGREITSLCAAAADYAMQTLGVCVHVNISTRWNDVKNVGQAYRMISDVESSRTFFTDMIGQVFSIPEGVFDRLNNTAERTEMEQSFLHASNRICGSIRAGEAEIAAGYLREELRQIAENSLGMPYPITLTLTINQFISVLQYTLVSEDLADLRYLARRDFSRDLVSSRDMAACLRLAEPVAAELEAHARARREAQHDRMMHEIRDYVERNATDMNIGLTAIARDFHIKPREAAESFRQYYGVSVNDVIHQTRVKKAKELILTTDNSIQSIAEAVGYCSLATMDRAFTNIEGVAPGKLRQNKSS